MVFNSLRRKYRKGRDVASAQEVLILEYFTSKIFEINILQIRMSCFAF